MRPWLLLLGAVLTLFGILASIRAIPRRSDQAGRLIPKQSVLELREESESALGGSRHTARFELVNRGRKTVRILAVKSGCGCATPDIDPRVVNPGQSTIVTVTPTPIGVGQRTVSITVETDSPTTPHVPLSLHLIGSRRPPYLYQASGEVIFSEADNSTTSAREVFVETIEPRESRPVTPMLSSDLGFLRFDPPVVTERPHATDPLLIGRSYRFLVRIGEPAPTGPFAGQVKVADPWDEGRIHFIPVLGELGAPIVVRPARIVLNLAGSGGSGATARFLVRATKPAPSLVVVPEDATSSALIVERVGSDESGRMFTFEVRRQADVKAVDEVTHLIARSGAPLDAEVRIPVLIRSKNGGADEGD